MLVKKLPREGFTKITVSDGLKKMLKRVAEAEGVSMPKLILNMTEKLYTDRLDVHDIFRLPTEDFLEIIDGVPSNELREYMRTHYPHLFVVRDPKKVYFIDGGYVAGEEIKRGDMVYFEPQEEPSHGV